MTRDLVVLGNESGVIRCMCMFMTVVVVVVVLSVQPLTVFDLQSLEDLSQHGILLGSHCFGCTAGEGSSCQGATTVAEEATA